MNKTIYNLIIKVEGTTQILPDEVKTEIEESLTVGGDLEHLKKLFNKILKIVGENNG